MKLSLLESPVGYLLSQRFALTILHPTAGCVGKGRDYSQLRKRLFDNMSAYLTRKEERIRGKESEKHHEAESEGGEGRPRAPKTPRVEEETVASGLPQQTEF